MSVEHRPRKVSAGRWEYRGRSIVRTDWPGDGPRGGTVYLWGLGTKDADGAVILDGLNTFPRLTEALDWIDRQENS